MTKAYFLKKWSILGYHDTLGTDHYKSDGGRGIFSLPEFFLAHFLCKNFFFGYSPMHEVFFLRKYFPYAQFAIELIINNATLFY